MFRDLSTYRFSCLFSLQNTRFSGLLSVQLFYVLSIFGCTTCIRPTVSQAELYLLEVDTTVLIPVSTCCGVSTVSVEQL
jgi:hypothetical protein